MQKSVSSTNRKNILTTTPIHIIIEDTTTDVMIKDTIKDTNNITTKDTTTDVIFKDNSDIITIVDNIEDSSLFNNNPTFDDNLKYILCKHFLIKSKSIEKTDCNEKYVYSLTKKISKKAANFILLILRCISQNKLCRATHIVDCLISNNEIWKGKYGFNVIHCRMIRNMIKYITKLIKTTTKKEKASTVHYQFYS